MQSEVKKFNLSNEYYFKEGCYIVEISNSESDPGCSIAQVRVQAGQSTKLHCLLDTIERYVILEGEGQIKLADSPVQKVKAKDVVIIPSSCPQKISNTGEIDLIFLAFCTPRFKVDCYQELAE